jgi:hypothetical protein
LFAPGHPALADAGLAIPNAIFAAGGGRPGHSRRSHSTIIPLALKLGLTENVTFCRGEEAAVARAALTCEGVVLIAWEHKLLPQIGHAIMGDRKTCPSIWPAERFDVIWVFDRTDAGWHFRQVPQRLRAGDRSGVIPMAAVSDRRD